MAAAGAVGLVWTVYEMACFLTLLPSLRWSDTMKVMLRQALAALYRILWRCLRFSSSTWECSSSWTRLSSCPLRADSSSVQKTVVCRRCSWWTCPLLRREVQFLNKVAMPVVATTGALRFYRAENCGGSLVAVLVDVCLRSSSLVVDVPVIMQRRFWCSSWTRSSSCPLRADSWGPDVQKTVLFLQGGGRPCDQAATFAKWKCHRFSSSPLSVDIPVVQQICLWRRCLDGRGTGFSAVLTPFFALLRLSRN